MPKKQPGWFLLKKILYCGAGEQLIYRDGRVELSDNTNCRGIRVAILDKSCYFETVRKFPFANLKDIRSAIEINASEYSPFGPGSFIVRKLGTSGEETIVNIWFLNPQTVARLSQLRPLLVFPQSALLATLNSGAPQLYRIRREQQKELFVGVDAQETVLSMFSTGDTERDWLQFVRSLGFSFQACSVTEIDDTAAYNSLLQQALRQLPLKKMSPFVYGDYFSATGAERQLKIGLGISAALLFVYLVLSFFVPYQAYQHLKVEDREISSKTSTLLEKQDKIQENYQQYLRLSEPINRYPVKSRLLKQLTRIIPQETQIKQLTISGNRVNLRGKTPKASLLISGLSQIDGVSDVHFSTPVRKDRKSTVEIFEIAFTYE